MGIAKNQMYALVRDKETSKPRVDDPTQLHPIQVGLMSKAEREELGIHSGSYARDADGIKKLEKLANGTFRAIDSLRAVNDIFSLGDNPDETALLTVYPRCDVPAGGIIDPARVHEGSAQ